MRRVILNLHGVGEPRRVMEIGEDRYWITQSFFQDVVSLSQDLQHVCACTFTADDGNLSDIEIVAPVLYDIRHASIFFVLTGRIGAAGSLDRTAICDLQQMGHKIGLHGCNHVPWIGLDVAGLQQEIHAPKYQLSDMIGEIVDTAAFPFGRYNRKVLASLRQVGFAECYSSDGGAAWKTAWPIHRTSLRADMTLEDVKNILLGRETLTQSIFRSVKGQIKKIL